MSTPAQTIRIVRLSANLATQLALDDGIPPCDAVHVGHYSAHLIRSGRSVGDAIVRSAKLIDGLRYIHGSARRPA